MTNNMDNERLPHVDIYIDGSCEPNPGIGGIGVLLIYGSHQRELSAYIGKSTNIRAEMMAAVAALDALNRPCQVTIYTDLKLLIQTASGEYRRGANMDLWTELDRASSGHNIRWKWVQGHNGDQHNERVHILANQGRLKGA